MQGIALVKNSRQDLLWLDSSYAINHASFNDPDLTTTQESLGGTFISSPVGVGVGDRLDVFGLGKDHGLYHKTYDPTKPLGNRWPRDWVRMSSINFTSAPVAVAVDNGIDLFCMGPDHGMLHTAWNGTRWSNWEELGGAFTSLPVVVNVGSSKFELFGRGMNYNVYHASWTRGELADWRPLNGLLGGPSAASAPAAVRVRNGVMVFVTGADGMIWFTQFDGKVWKRWMSLGMGQPDIYQPNSLVKFISEPVVVALFPLSEGVDPGGKTTGGVVTGSNQLPTIIDSRTRVDVFAVGEDNEQVHQLYHRILDSTFQSVEEAADGRDGRPFRPLGGSFACAPSVIASSHPKGVFGVPPADFHLVAPDMDGTIHRWRYNVEWTPTCDAGQWCEDQDANQRPSYSLAGRYNFAVDCVQIDQTMAPHEDTDVIVANLQVGNWPLKTIYYSMDDVNNGSYLLNGKAAIVSLVELCEPVIFTYTIINKYGSDSESVGKSLAQQVTKGLEDVFKNQLKDAMKEAVGDVTGFIATVAISAFVSWFVDNIVGFFFGGDDGMVALNVTPYGSGSVVEDQLTSHGNTIPSKFEMSVHHSGVNPPPGANTPSYLVVSSITPV